MDGMSRGNYRFSNLNDRPSQQQVQDAMPVLERIVIIMYDRTSPCESVNEARKVLFSQKGRPLESIPLTSDALILHTKRVVYQAGHCWGQCLIPIPELPSPIEWGWIKSDFGSWKPLWTTIPQASKVCQELLRSGCNPEKGCVGRCKCVKA